MNSKRLMAFVAIVFACAFVVPPSRALEDALQPASPRLQALKRELEAGNRNSLESFWQDLAKQTTPIVESIGGDSTDVLVTFVWRGNDDTKNVVLFGGPAGSEVEKNRLDRVLDTDLWVKTFKLRSDARFVYNLSPNDSLVSFSELKPDDLQAVMKRVSTFTTDPLNPHKISTGFLEQSVVELAGAPSQPYIKKESRAPEGKVEEKKISSAILKNERKIWVYTPAAYEASGRPYGLLVAFDGMAYVATVPTPVILDNLTAKGLIAPMVAVVLDNPTPTSRNAELPCSEPFAEFLATELVPWVRQNYHVTADPKQVVVAGSSFGGLASMWVGFRHSEIFGNVLSQSGSYWWRPAGNAGKPVDEEHEWLTRQFVASAKLPLKIYMDVGLMELGPTLGDGPTMVVTNRHMRDVLRAKDYAVHYAEFNGGHEYLNWRGTLADGLIYLVGIGAAGKKG